VTAGVLTGTAVAGVTAKGLVLEVVGAEHPASSVTRLVRINKPKLRMSMIFPESLIQKYRSVQ